MVVERAPTAAAALEPLDGCADLTRLAAPLALPGDPRRRDAIAEARRLLADAVTRHDAGKYVEALPLLGTAVAIGRALAYPPLEAEALYRLGRLQDRLGDAVAAEETLFAATVAATHGGHLEVAADAQIELIFVAGVILAKSEVGRHAGEQGAALLARLGDDPGRRAKLLRYQGFLLDAQSRYPEARARFLDALALEEQLGDGPSIELAGVLTAIFKNDYREGRYAAALPNARRALAMIESTVGPHHPFVGFAATNLGAVLDALRRYPEALEQHSRSLAVLEAVVGPDHPEVARTLVNTAQAYVSLGRYDEAIAASRRAIAISERMSSPHEDLAVFYQGLGDALLALERLPESHAAYQTAADIQEKKWGPEDVTLAEILHRLRAPAPARGQPRAGLPRVPPRARHLREADGPRLRGHRDRAGIDGRGALRARAYRRRAGQRRESARDAGEAGWPRAPRRRRRAAPARRAAARSRRARPGDPRVRPRRRHLSAG
jgi:tetratricopeptide (TPR) repeat protein